MPVLTGSPSAFAEHLRNLRQVNQFLIFLPSEGEKNLVAPPPQYLPEHDLRSAAPVRIGGIEVVYPKVKGVPDQVLLTRREAVRA